MTAFAPLRVMWVRSGWWGASRKETKTVYVLKIDFAMLRTRISLLERRSMTNGDIMAWLLDRGFQAIRGGWKASAERLQLLQLREIIISYPINDASAP